MRLMTIFCEKQKLCGSSSSNYLRPPLSTSSPQMFTSTLPSQATSFSLCRKCSCPSKTARSISFLYHKRAKLMYVYKNVNLRQINCYIRPSAYLALRSVYCYSPCLQARALPKRNKLFPEQRTRSSYSVSIYMQSDTKKTGTFKKPNINWRNPRKKKLLTEIEPLQLAF